MTTTHPRTLTIRAGQTLAGYVGLVYQEDPGQDDPRKRLRGATLVAACRHAHRTLLAAKACAARMRRSKDPSGSAEWRED